MGIDLNLINRLWTEAKKQLPPDQGDLASYFPILMAGVALLSNKKLAQEFVDESWENP